MRWPWQRREEHGASPATLAATVRAEIAQERAQRAADDTQEIERRAAELAAELTPGELFMRLAQAFRPEHH